MLKFVKKLFILTVCSSAVMASGSIWTEDFEAAKKEAKKSGKDLLMDFTGSDWCGWCIKLDKEVFDKEYFIKEAPKDFVLVKLDFPRDKSNLRAETEAQNQKLAQKYNIKGYPTIILATANGEPYETTGYREGGPQEYIKYLREVKSYIGNLKKQVQNAYAEENLTLRAEKLDQALSAMKPETIDKHFQDVVDDIIALDPDNKMKLRNKYQIPRELNNLYQYVQTPDVFIEKADEVIKKLNLEGDDLQMMNDIKLEVKIQAEMSKLSEFNEDAEKLLSGLDYIIENLKLEGKYKQQILTQKVMVHLQLNSDIPAAIEAADLAIAALPDSETAIKLDEFKASLKAEMENPQEGQADDQGKDETNSVPIGRVQ